MASIQKPLPNNTAMCLFKQKFRVTAFGLDGAVRVPQIQTDQGCFFITILRLKKLMGLLLLAILRISYRLQEQLPEARDSVDM